MSATNNLPTLSLEAAKIAAAAAEEKAKELGIGALMNKNISDSNTNLPIISSITIDPSHQPPTNHISSPQIPSLLTPSTQIST